MTRHPKIAAFAIFCGFLLSVATWSDADEPDVRAEQDVAAAERRLTDFDKQIAEALRDNLLTSLKVADLRIARADYYKQVEPRLMKLLALRQSELQALAREMQPTAAPMEAKQAEVDRLKRLLVYVNSLGMKFVRIEPGTFMMGSPANEVGRFDDETLHKVTLTHPFNMAATHVTRGQFAAFVADTGYKTEAEREGKGNVFDGTGFGEVAGASWRKPGFEQTDEHPVVLVSWNDAVAFCNWLSRRELKTYRLPTEAEWEFACRAGAQTRWFWGDDPDGGKGYANCYDQTAKDVFGSNAAFNWRDGFVFTSPVGFFKPNKFGLYDMIGNAVEWCSDYYDAYPPGDAVDPSGPAIGDSTTPRVLRGGSWGYIPQFCRVSHRYGFLPGYRNNFYGLRLCLDFNGQHAHAPAVPNDNFMIARLNKVGDTWTNSIGMKFTYIPAGEFDTGSPPTEPGRARDETLFHVKIAKPFLMATTPVTQAQWKALMDTNPSYFKGDNLPVERMDWWEAAEFCRTLGDNEGRHYRLPTEDEWEYACRAGTTTRYNTGSDEKALAAAAWYSANSGNKTHPVGKKMPNKWGLYDMHGNVWQLCYDPAPYRTGPRREMTEYPVRGGSWGEDAANCRSAARNTDWKLDWYHSAGFRVVLDLR